jgi:predicted regulator of Ras-like GTPase activity (Roadblock/LC7/MglB family)
VSDRERLEALMALPGVRGAAVATADGEALDVVGAAPGDEEEVRGLIAGGLASARSLAELFGDGRLEQATVGLERGPVVLQPLPGRSGHLLVALLAHEAALGRVRAVMAREGVPQAGRGRQAGPGEEPEA